MNYDRQRAFLQRQRWRLLPAATGCARSVGWFSAELLRKRHFMVLEKEG